MKSNETVTPSQPRAAIYTRVSTAAQEDDGTSLATQEARCRAFASDHSYRVIGAYSDTWTAAEYRQRPALSELRDAIRSGAVDIVIAYALDRLSRNQAHIYILAEEAEAHGARLEFVTESFEDSTIGRFLRSAKAFAAEVEHEKIAERSVRGKRARVANGKPLFGPKPPYGLRWNDDQKCYVRYEPEAVIVRRIADRYLSGGSIYKIAKELNDDGIPGPTGKGWFASTIRLFLREERYAGIGRSYRNKTERTDGRWLRIEVPDGWADELPDGIFPVIITPEERAAILDRLSQNKALSPRNNREYEHYLLRAGFATCGICGGNMVAFHEQERDYYRYRCGNGTRTAGTMCRPISIDAATLDAAVWSVVEEVLTQPDVIERQLSALIAHNPNENEIAAIDKALDDIRKQQTRLASSLTLFGDDLDAAAPVIDRLRQLTAQEKRMNQERTDVEGRLAEWKAAQQRLGDIVAWCRRVSTGIDRLDYEQKRLTLSALGVKATVYPADRTPRYKIEMTIPLEGEEWSTFVESTSLFAQPITACRRALSGWPGNCAFS